MGHIPPRRPPQNHLPHPSRYFGNRFEMKRGQVEGKLVMGSVTVDDPWVEFCEIMPKAIVGSRFLADYVVSVDAKSRRIWLRKPATLSPTIEPKLPDDDH